MLLIGQRIDGGNGGVAGEFLEVLLRIRAKNGPVHHSPEYPRRIFDWFATAKLTFSRRQKNDLAAQFTNADIERNARASGGF